VKKEDISVTVEGDYLVVSAERKMCEEVKKEDYYLLESAFGKYARTFYLPEDIDREKIDAKFEDGRLLLTFEKISSKKRKDIAIK
jgi:HSP20 family protein